jgi:hypothetical protein
MCQWFVISRKNNNCVFICVNNELSKIENCAYPSAYNKDCMHVYVIQDIFTCICIYASHNTECLLLSTLNTFNYDDDGQW